MEMALDYQIGVHGNGIQLSAMDLPGFLVFDPPTQYSADPGAVNNRFEGTIVVYFSTTSILVPMPLPLHSLWHPKTRSPRRRLPELCACGLVMSLELTPESVIGGYI
jgi:hypothetical protein